MLSLQFLLMLAYVMSSYVYVAGVEIKRCLSLHADAVPPDSLLPRPFRRCHL